MKALIDKLDHSLIVNHRTDTDLFERLNDRQRASGLLHGDRTISPFLRPYFLAESRYSEICHAALVLSSAFEKLTRLALEDTSVRDLLGLSEKEFRWASVEPGYACVSVNSRLDTFISPTGFAFLEYNGENPAGIGDQTALEQLFAEVPEVRHFLASYPHFFPQPSHRLIASLDETYREFGGQKQKPAIAIVDWNGVASGAEFNILLEYFESRGYPAKICDPSELEFEHGVLRHEDFAIDILFKRVIIHEFLDRFDERHPLFEAMRSRAVCMANSFRSKIPHKKAGFSILSDPKFQWLFTNKERSTIARCIPWTRVVRDEGTDLNGNQVDLLELVRAQKDHFVLKPNDDYGGKGIVLGWECSAGAWDSAIQKALSHPHIVQRRVPVEKTDIPMFRDGEVKRESMVVDFDPFLFRGEVEGGMVRLSHSPIVNISQGGGETALAIFKGF